jgi:hypothetical protein
MGTLGFALGGDICRAPFFWEKAEQKVFEVIL